MHGAGKPVFLSYSRSASRPMALALEARLGAERVFRDESDLREGEAFPTQLFDALLDARVFVGLIGTSYWESWFCRAELRVAFTAAGLEPRHAQGARGVVLGVQRDEWRFLAEHFPLAIQQIQWPELDDPEAIARLVERQLEDAELPSLRERLDEEAVAALREWLATEALLQPRRTFLPGQLVYNLPPIPDDALAGRETELQVMERRLTAPDARNALALVGPGGIGKSRLAVEFTWRYGPRHFPGGVVWIRALEEGDLEAQLFNLLLQLEPDLPTLRHLRPLNFDVRSQLRQALARRADRGPLLWVVDDIPEPNPSRPAVGLDHWTIELPGQIALLATSRSRQWPSAINLVLEPVSTEAAARLLREGPVRRFVTAEEAEAIAQRLGRWPLALMLLSKVFEEGGLRPDEFLSMSALHSAPESIDLALATLGSEFPREALRGVSETFRLSFDNLPVSARELALALAWCQPEVPIPLELVELLSSHTPASRSTLRARNYVLGGEERSFGTMHALVAEDLRQRDPGCAGLRRLESALAQLTQRLPLEAVHRPQAEALLPHVRYLCLSESTSGEPLVTMVHWATRWLAKWMVRPDARAFNEAVLALHHDRADLPAGGRAQLQADWAVPHIQARPDEAVHALLEASIAELTTVFGPDHALVLEAEITLAELLPVRGLWNEAARHFDALIPRVARRFGESARSTLDLRHTLAIIYWQQGRLEEARAQTDALLADTRFALGRFDHLTLKLEYLLCLIQFRLEPTAEVLAQLEPVCALTREVRGAMHPDTLIVQGSLAVVRAELCQYPQARSELAAALQAFDRLIGTSHPRYLRVASNLAFLEYLDGQLLDARRRYETTLDGMRAVLPAEHYEILHATIGYAMVLGELGEVASARSLLAHVLAERQAALGPNHPDTRSATLDLAEWALRDGEPEVARHLLDALATAQEASSRDGALIAMKSARVRAMLARLTEDAAHGLTTLEPALALSIERLPEQHPERLRLLLEESRLLKSLGQAEVAAAREAQLRALVAAHLTPGHYFERRLNG